MPYFFEETVPTAFVDLGDEIVDLGEDAWEGIVEFNNSTYFTKWRISRNRLESGFLIVVGCDFRSTGTAHEYCWEDYGNAIQSKLNDLARFKISGPLRGFSNIRE